MKYSKILIIYVIASVFPAYSHAASMEMLSLCIGVQEPVTKIFMACALIFIGMYVPNIFNQKYLESKLFFFKYIAYIIAYLVILVAIIAINFITYFIFEDMVEYAIYSSTFAISFFLLKYSEKYNKRHATNMRGVDIIKFFIKVIAVSLLMSFVFAYIYWVQVFSDVLYPAIPVCG